MTDRRAPRPTIETDATLTRPEEAFQNQTLRPVLKMQHELLLGVFRHYLRKRKVPFQHAGADRREELIARAVSKDNRLRGLLFGMVIGQFTPAEMTTYLEQEGEFNRRITSMLIQRLFDGMMNT